MGNIGRCYPPVVHSSPTAAQHVLNRILSLFAFAGYNSRGYSPDEKTSAPSAQHGSHGISPPASCMKLLEPPPEYTQENLWVSPLHNQRLEGVPVHGSCREPTASSLCTSRVVLPFVLHDIFP